MRSVLLLRLDGMGDIILFEPVLRALRSAWPQTRLTMLVQQRYMELGPLVAPEVNWVGTTIDPIRAGPAEAAGQLADLQKWVEQIQPEMIVACTSRRNWLDTAVASMVPLARRIAFEMDGEDAYFGPQLRSLQPGTLNAAFSEIAEPAPDDQVWRRNAGLVRQIVGRAIELTPPQLSVSPAGGPVGIEVPPAGSYIVCAPAGFANVPIKTWPAENFSAVLRWLHSAHGLQTVLVGSASESNYLAGIAKASGARVWSPRGDPWRELTHLLAHSRLCLGNDTGILHLAGAVKCPVVGVFGGGTWPRFVPAGPGVAVVNPLPCFGCGWDCVFGDAPCVKIIAPASVQAAMTAVLEHKPEGACAIDETHHFLPETAELMGSAAQRWRERATALDQRERQFQETVLLASAKDGEIRQLKAAANAKDVEIEAKDAEIQIKDAEIQTKDAEIQIKDAEIQSKDGENKALKRETDGKDNEIAALKQATTAKDREIEAKDREIQSIKASAEARRLAAIGSAAEAERIRTVADGRAADLQKLHEACAALQKACDERLALIQRLDGELKALALKGKSGA